MDEPRPPGPPAPHATRPPRPRKNVPMLLLALGLITIVVLVVTNRGPEPVKTTIGELEQDIVNGHVDKLVIVGGNRVEGEYRGGDHGHKSSTFVIPYTGPVLNNPLTPELQRDWARLLKDKKAHFETRDDSGDFGKQVL